jgi:hypothetical protein
VQRLAGREQTLHQARGHWRVQHHFENDRGVHHAVHMSN